MAGDETKTATLHLQELEAGMAEAEALLERRSSGSPPSAKEEHSCWVDLKKCLGRTSGDLRKARSLLSSSTKELSRLEPDERSLVVERDSTLRSMASGHMSRVGAPSQAVSAVRTADTTKHEAGMMSVIQLGAEAEYFTSLYEEVRNGATAWEDWVCPPEAVTLPDKDLLGMCPGGKPHLSKEQLKARKSTRCYCSICQVDARLQTIRPQINKLRRNIAEARERIRTVTPGHRDAKRVLKRLRKGEDDDEEREDPVFCNEGFEPEDEEMALAHCTAQQEWSRLQSTLRVEDFPLRVAFLDKSASMGFDEVTYDALQLGLHNCLHPTTGATLTILFAGPGETQILLRRPGDPPMTFDMELGSSTWFNEPILRTLTILAPLVEALDTQQWMMQTGVPPVQVLCMTDGFDNRSPSNLSTLGGLVQELKEIRGPVSGEKLYVPIASPVSKHKGLLDATNTKIPVWMAWIATGMGGQALLQSKTPKEVCIIDAVAAPRLREPAALPDCNEGGRDDKASEGDVENSTSRQGGQGAHRSTVASTARKRVSALQSASSLADALEAAETSKPSWNVGQRVRVRATEPGRAPKSALVLRLVQEEEGQPAQYELLFDDESQEVVAESQLCGSPAEIKPLVGVRKGAAGVRVRGQNQNCGMLARTSEPDMQRLQVLSVVKNATSDLAAVMGGKKNPKTGSISLEDAVAAANGSAEIGEDVAAALENQLVEAQEFAKLSTPPESPPCDPTQALLDTLLKVGSSAARMLPEDRLVAQRLLAAGMEMMMFGGSLMPDHLVDQLGHFADIAQEKATRRMKPEPEELEAWYRELSGPLRTLLRSLVNLHMVESRQTPEGEVLQAIPDARPGFVVLRRFFEPSTTRSGVEDAIRRCVNRCQRLRPALRASITKVDSSPFFPQGPHSKAKEGRRSAADIVVHRKPSSPACSTSTRLPYLSSPASSSSHFSSSASTFESPDARQNSQEGLTFTRTAASRRSNSSSSSSRSGESFSPAHFGGRTSLADSSSPRPRSSSLAASGLRLISPGR
eukprot:TRINITY_DN110514_c0_g1_i1.p1 TRINITY_DN110514_c0_g1~~TRINITY_DN110514_c0_g1_i1.p1  ORF type:complete len:1030 (-),score=184.62 TRINITY_DN110514_c0_g1_i1:127-3216(-)